MRTLLLNIVVPFVLVVIFLNSPLHDTGQAPVTRTSPAMADYAARERAARERRIAAAEARAARESQNEIDAINVENRAEYEQRNGGGAPPQRDVGSARRTSTPQPRMVRALGRPGCKASSILRCRTSRRSWSSQVFRRRCHARAICASSPTRSMTGANWSSRPSRPVGSGDSSCTTWTSETDRLFY